MRNSRTTGVQVQSRHTNLSTAEDQPGTATGLSPGLGLSMQELADILPFYIRLVDEDHHVLLVNKAVAGDLGVGPEDILAEHCPEAAHGCDHPIEGCSLAEAIERGHVVEREVFDSKSGRWVASAIYPTGHRTPNGRAIFVHIVQDITAKKQVEEGIRRYSEVQTVMCTLLHTSLLGISLEKQLSLILEYLISIPWLTVESKGAIFLVEDDPEALVMKAQHGLAKPLLNTCARVPFGRCLCGRVALSGETAFADCLDDRHDNRYDGISPHGHYCVPILLAGKVLGVINLYLAEGHRYDEREAEFLRAVADVLAGIVDRRRAQEGLQRSLEKLQENLEQTVQLMATIVGTRDPYTAGHQRRVANLAVAIAVQMGLSDNQIKGIRLTGLIHDIGKISIPAEILSKPDRLTGAEFNLIKAHPRVAHDILKTIEFPWPIAKIVLQHHERMDGSGYPSSLSGEEILPEARILAVADVVEAMASHRPYRPSRGIELALDEISRNSGILYDRKVAEACLKLLKERGFNEVVNT